MIHKFDIENFFPYINKKSKLDFCLFKKLLALF